MKLHTYTFKEMQIETRLAYELALGKRCSDSHWWRIRKLLERHNLELTVKNVQFLVELRKKAPKTATGTSGLLEAYQRATELTSKAKGTLKGGEIAKILLQFGITAHRTTISRWFKESAGGYKRNQDYKAEQVRDILIHAFLYKASTTHKLPEVS